MESSNSHAVQVNRRFSEVAGSFEFVDHLNESIFHFLRYSVWHQDDRVSGRVVYTYYAGTVFSQ